MRVCPTCVFGLFARNVPKMFAALLSLQLIPLPIRRKNKITRGFSFRSYDEKTRGMQKIARWVQFNALTIQRQSQVLLAFQSPFVAVFVQTGPEPALTTVYNNFLLSNSV